MLIELLYPSPRRSTDHALVRGRGILGDSRLACDDGIILVEEPVTPRRGMREKGEDDAQDAQSKAGRAAPVRSTGGVRAGGDGTCMDGPRSSSGWRERGGS